MTSWRDTTSEQAQADLDGLLKATLPFAQESVVKRRQLAPFGVHVTVDGETLPIQAKPDADAGVIKGQDVVNTIIDVSRAQRDEIRAVVIMSAVGSEEGEALFAHLEHAEGTSLGVVLPYTVAKDARRSLEFGDLAAVPSTPRIWTDPEQ